MNPLFRRPIAIGLSPNTQSDDVWLALETLLKPYTWKAGEATYEVEQWFCKYFSVGHAVSFNSGRSALLALLKAFDIGEGDEVLVQAFTCVAVPNSILWTGAKPVFVDIDETLNVDPVDLEKKITQRTKAVIVQHTFGIPAQMDKVLTLAKKHNMILIEDCAHALGGSYNGKRLGTLGDAAFFSFGRDKVISSVFGGMAIINQKSPARPPGRAKIKNQKLREYQGRLPYPSYIWIFQQLLHPIAFFFILPIYNVAIGKVLLVLLQKLGLLSFPVYPQEKRGEQPREFPARFPNALARLALRQFGKVAQYNDNRAVIAGYYDSVLRKSKKVTIQDGREGAIYLRYPLLTPNPLEMVRNARRNGILLGNWYHNVVDPKGVDLACVGYKPGSCPRAEEAALHIVNLPTRISKRSAEKVVAAIYPYV